MGGKEGSSRIVLTLVQAVPCLECHTHTTECHTPARVSYREQQADLRRRLGRVYDLRLGHLLDTMERGVLYPVLSINWSPGTDAAAKCSKMKDDQFGPDLYVLQGLYEEVRRIEPASSRVESNQPRSYIILGFKSLESSISSVLENTWRDWTGARSIYLNLHSDFDLVKIVFYHRVSPKFQLDLFMYLVLVEVANVTTDNLIRLLDFVQRTRVERMTGYISLYRDLGVMDSDSNYYSGTEADRAGSTLSQYQEKASKLTSSTDSLLAADSLEALNLPDPLRAVPYSTKSKESRRGEEESFLSMDPIFYTSDRNSSVSRTSSVSSSRGESNNSSRGESHNSSRESQHSNGRESVVSRDSPYCTTSRDSPYCPTSSTQSSRSAYTSSITQHHYAITQHHQKTVTHPHTTITQQHTPITQQHTPITQQHTPITQQHTPTTQQHTPIIQQHTSITQQLTPRTQQPSSSKNSGRVVAPPSNYSNHHHASSSSSSPCSSSSSTTNSVRLSHSASTSRIAHFSGKSVTESPPTGFTSQVTQLQEALSLLPTVPKKDNHTVHKRVQTTIANTIRSSLIIKTKQ